MKNGAGGRDKRSGKKAREQSKPLASSRRKSGTSGPCRIKDCASLHCCKPQGSGDSGWSLPCATTWGRNVKAVRAGAPALKSPPAPSKPALTLGPLYFHWPEEERRDFYYRIADEADVDVVYLGETVCSKREPFFEPYRQKVIDRLTKAGKQVVLSSLAMVTTPREMASIKDKAKSGMLVEANDLAAVQVLAGKPFVVGPFINVMNEGTRDYFKRLGATRIVFASELSGAAMEVLAEGKTLARGSGPASLKIAKNACLEFEVQVFGRQPLSVAMRCYAARAEGRNKDGCRFACSSSPDGLPVDDFIGQPILAVSGTMTMSHGYVVLLRAMKNLQRQGVSLFRLSPQRVDMARVAALYREVIQGAREPESALENLRKLVTDTPLINGFFHAKEGMVWVDKPGRRGFRRKKPAC